MFELETDVYRIHLDGEWTFDDLNKFSRLYSQLYSFHYSLKSTYLSRSHTSRDFDYSPDFDYWSKHPYVVHPWIGGWDVVNFYRGLDKRVLPTHRLTLVGIRYGSPGWIDVKSVIAIAIDIQIIVLFLAANVRIINKVYNDITKGIQQRKLTDIRIKREGLQLTREQIQFLEDSNWRLIRSLNLKHAEELPRLTGNPLTTIRILRSLKRIIAKLSKYVTDNKIDL